jgi:adenylylsulfate kinase
MASIAPGATVTAGCVWLTGPPGAGKRTIAQGVMDALHARGVDAALLDEDTVGAHLADGVESIAWLCRLLVTHGVPVIVSVELPARRERDELRESVPGFVEVFIDRGARDDEYEEPFAPELRVPTHDREPAASIAQLLSWLEDAGVVGPEL